MIKTIWASVLAAGIAGQGIAQETTVVSGLSGPVTIATPATGVPSIVASNAQDAAFAQGYVQASQRFFQMDITRRSISGRLAEMVGSSVIGQDIQLRTLGLRRAAWESWAASSEETRAIVRAYSRGVNAWLNANDLPLEYGALELSDVPPWTPVDTFAVGKALAFQLSFDLEDIDLTVTVGTYQGVGNAVGFDGTALFFEDTHRSAPPDDRVSLPDFLSSIGGIGKSQDAAASMASNFPEIPVEQQEFAARISENLKRNPLLVSAFTNDVEDKGSNWWVASGSITETGVPMLANDPHLSLDTPSTFVPMHVAQVDDEGNTTFTTSGVSVPGVPGTVQGCNSFLCWGSTVNPIDETDSYFENIRVNSLGLPTHTIHNGEAEPILWIFQNYFANSVGDGVMDNVNKLDIGIDAGAISFVVPRRNNGPIVDIDGNQAVSVQYTGWGPTLEIEAFLEAGAATDVFEFGQALEKFDFGAQNFAVADTSGNIAYYAAAEVPVRSDLQLLNQPDGGIPPLFIRDGSGTLMHDWLPVTNPQPNQSTPTEILPSSELPNAINPASGYILNANNDPVGTSLDNNPLNQVRPGGGLYYLSPGAYSSYRMGRIDRLMSDAVAAGPVTADQFKAFQANNQLLDAELLMPYILEAVDNAMADGAWPGIAAFMGDPRMQTVAGLFSQWDFSTPTGIPEGYDPGDDPFGLTMPGSDEIEASVAASVYSGWRGQMIQNTIDATLSAVGLSGNLPNGQLAFNALKHHLDTFAASKGVGASGLNFFTNPEAPTPEDARDFVILASLMQTLDLFASDAFAPAFANSTDVMDYRWGRLHRIVLDHPLGDPLSLPNVQGLYGLVQPDGLRGVARSGGYQVLDASSHNTRADGVEEFRFGSGPARRFVGLMFPEGIAAEQIIPGGQSGVFGDPNYANQLYFWLVNGYLPLIIDPNVALGIADSVQVLQPGG